MACNPILAEVTRGEIIESFHRASLAIVNSDGELLVSEGDIERQVYPRSAIKALQAIPLIDSGAANAFGFSPDEIALACASHGGEPDHIRAAYSMLQKAGIDENCLQCGPQWPTFEAATIKLAADGATPGNIHNNCSGKHAGMLATAKFLGEPLANYIDVDHPVQQRIAGFISQLCQCGLKEAPCGIDGCSVPTWAIPLRNLALGFARLGFAGRGFPGLEADHGQPWGNAAREIIRSIRSSPYFVAGSGEFCTNIMKAVPRLFAKTGAEGVYCGIVPHAGIAIAVKCDDGATRAAEVIFAKALSRLDVWKPQEISALTTFSQMDLLNRNAIKVGEVRAC